MCTYAYTLRIVSECAQQLLLTHTSLPRPKFAVVALDVCWYLKLYGRCDRVKSLYATVVDFLEKNDEKIAAPKGDGGGMNMF